MNVVTLHADWSGELSKAFLQTSEWVRQLPEGLQATPQALLDEVEKSMNGRPSPLSPHRLGEWWSGSRIEATWTLLHQVQLEILGTAPLALMQQLFEVVTEHGQGLNADDTARVQLADFIARMRGPLGDADIIRGQ
jgi:hypothetical protein